jgi:uncharacterized protein (DUF2235 family)
MRGQVASMKNLVLCLDGTGNQLRATRNTNVVLLYEMLDLSDPARQIAFYDPGVGTFSSGAAWTPVGKRSSRIAGLAFGVGLRTNLAEAYTWLMQHWEPGDQVYVFGFSRGAYSARALTGMLRTVGLTRPGLETLVPYAVRAHTRRFNEKSKDDYWGTVHEFAKAFAQSVDGTHTTVPITYLGLWDTVKAAGILRWEIKWPYTNTLPNVGRCRHAISIDEKRRAFKHDPVEAIADGGSLEQVWFAGVHSDVGGTFGGQEPKLSTIALKWIVEDAVGAGLLVKPRTYGNACTVGELNAQGTVHQMGKIWALATYKHRSVPDGALVHSSVEQRRLTEPTYGDKRFQGSVTYVDTPWAGTPALPPAP